MKELRKRLDGINEEKSQFNLSGDVHDKIIVPWRETHSFVTPLVMIGRNEEKEMILELLRRSNDGGVGMIGVISILGMGGIGKTVLTQLVYNDNWVNKYFDLKVWLTMPLGFETENIIRRILKSLGHKNKDDGLEMLQHILRSIVWNKRCLFVMDNVWEVRREGWVEFRNLLRGASEGSKVIVTLRNMSVASIMGCVRPLNLTGLSWNDSFTLFVKCAFDQEQEKNHPDLMEIANAIVKKCWGNPLAVKSLRSLLYSKYNKTDWAYVRDSEMWQLQTDILPSLRISYDIMPSYLKQCFQ
ncbi:putative disease resistance protein RGA4 [Syzygium oleosum]|uniref:putative disease resistance protein RGA4 n=1 Tax=Syzygium oleosum TaxID=219896 RepID=UPI0024BAAE67|nr:putative disease resistance protein RGA4 [Syzygium oleosum]